MCTIEKESPAAYFMGRGVLRKKEQGKKETGNEYFGY